MPFRPQSLAHRIRRLVDAGILTPEQICASCGIGRLTLDKIMKGATPSRQTEHSISRVLSYHVRRENRHLKIEEGTGEILDVPEEGVFEELDAAPGQVELKARDGKGARMALLQFRADTVDDELLSDLERWHQRMNPTHLTLAESSEHPS